MGVQYNFSWAALQSLPQRQYACGFCGNIVGSDRGYHAGSQGWVYVCPYCSAPTFFHVNPVTSEVRRQIPGVAFGDTVEHVPESVHVLYDESRQCFSVDAFTSSVLACRKLLMNIAVHEGADEGKAFIEYIDWLAAEGYVPPNGKVWANRIREIGNEATHEIAVKTREEAETLLSFVGMLLKFIYEFPAKAQP